jgi:hypothetical protein
MTDTLTKMEHGIFVVDFTKEDDSHRKMLATRNMSFIPPDRWPKGKNRLEPVTSQTDRVVVWDLEAGEYRSFLLSRVTNMVAVRSGVIRTNSGKISGYGS